MNYPRYTVFNRYVFGKYVDEGYEGHTFEKYKDNISDENYMRWSRNIHQDKMIVKKD